MDRKHNFPVFVTQGGGLVREISQNPYVYVFVEKPDCPGLDVGETMPKEWDIVPANQAARNLIADEQFGSSDPFVDHGEFDGLNDELAEQVNPIDEIRVGEKVTNGLLQYRSCDTGS